MTTACCWYCTATARWISSKVNSLFSCSELQCVAVCVWTSKVTQQSRIFQTGIHFALQKDFAMDTSRGTHMTGSCYTYYWVTLCIEMSYDTHEWVMAHRLIRIYIEAYICEKVMAHVHEQIIAHINESIMAHTYEWVMAHIYESVTAHIYEWISKLLCAEDPVSSSRISHIIHIIS